MKKLIEEVENWLRESGQMFVDLEHVFHPNIYVHVSSIMIYRNGGFPQTKVKIFQRFRKGKKHPKGQVTEIKDVSDELRKLIIDRLKTDSHRMGAKKRRRLELFRRP
jgi:hypothetical protein